MTLEQAMERARLGLDWGDYIDRIAVKVLAAEIERLNAHTYCVYCGASFDIDGDADKITEHIRSCEQHPMRAVEAEVERLRAVVDRLPKTADGVP